MSWKTYVEDNVIKQLKEEKEKLAKDLEECRKVLEAEKQKLLEANRDIEFWKEESSQLKTDLSDLKSKYLNIQCRAVPSWLNSIDMNKHKIVLVPFNGDIYVMKKEDIVIKSIMFCNCDKIYKLSQEYKLPNKLYIGFNIVDNKIRCSGIFYNKNGFYRYYSAHSSSYICATFSPTVCSLEDYLRAVTFIKISLETLNLGSVFDFEEWNRSFKNIFEKIMKEATGIAPVEALGGNGLPLVNNTLFNFSDL